MPHFITIVPRAAATEPDIPVYELDYKRLAHKVVRHLLERLEERKPLSDHIAHKGRTESHHIRPVKPEGPSVPTGCLYFERFREELVPPKTFADYNRIASFFTRSLAAQQGPAAGDRSEAQLASNAGHF